MKEIQRLQRERERARRAAERETRRIHAESQLAQVASLNEQVQSRIGELENLLVAIIKRDWSVDFETLKRSPQLTAFDPGQLGKPAPAPRPPDRARSNALVRLFLTKRAEEERAERNRRAWQEYERAVANHPRLEAERVQRLEDAEKEHREESERRFQRARAFNAEIDAFEQSFEEGEPNAVIRYLGLVLERIALPESFPKYYKLGVDSASSQLVVELDLPSIDVVPVVSERRYVRSRDEIIAKALPIARRRSMYSSAVAQLVLGVLKVVFDADRQGTIETVVVNGYVDADDPRTGRLVRPCLVTVRTTRERVSGLDLERVDPIACLKGLNASVSKSPGELIPVRPVVEFSMVDPRFIEEVDVIGELDKRPNLMELTPREFEGLITNLFAKMGLETRQTQASRDGGVDCVAYDQRPILGGKVVIQAKRYKNTVGVSAVRDLYGTLQNEGASKGILVTTSGYGKASFEFADGKPIELLSGANLLHLLAEHTGLEAKIEPPDDWVDPLPDSEGSEI